LQAQGQFPSLYYMGNFLASFTRQKDPSAVWDLVLVCDRLQRYINKNLIKKIYSSRNL
jgi:hypothetical protein